MGEDMEDTVEVMAMVMATVTATATTATARGRPRLRLRLSPPLLPSLDMDMVTVLTGTDTPPHTPTDTAVTMARGQLMLSPDMVTTAVDTEDTTEGMDTTDTAMV